MKDNQTHNQEAQATDQEKHNQGKPGTMLYTILGGVAVIVIIELIQAL